MKILWSVTLLLGIAAAGTLNKASSQQEIAQFLSSHDEGLGSLYFYDASKDDEKGVLNTVGNLLAETVGAEDSKSESVQQMADISEEIDLLAVDVSNPDFQETAALYEVSAVPYLIVFNEGVAAIKEEPNAQTLKKVQAFKRI